MKKIIVAIGLIVGSFSAHADGAKAYQYLQEMAHKQAFGVGDYGGPHVSKISGTICKPVFEWEPWQYAGQQQIQRGGWVEIDFSQLRAIEGPDYDARGASFGTVGADGSVRESAQYGEPRIIAGSRSAFVSLNYGSNSSDLVADALVRAMKDLMRACGGGLHDYP